MVGDGCGGEAKEESTNLLGVFDVLSITEAHKVVQGLKASVKGGVKLSNTPPSVTDEGAGDLDARGEGNAGRGSKLKVSRANVGERCGGLDLGDVGGEAGESAGDSTLV